MPGTNGDTRPLEYPMFKGLQRPLEFMGIKGLHSKKNDKGVFVYARSKGL